MDHDVETHAIRLAEQLLRDGLTTFPDDDWDVAREIYDPGHRKRVLQAMREAERIIADGGL